MSIKYTLYNFNTVDPTFNRKYLSGGSKRSRSHLNQIDHHYLLCNIKKRIIRCVSSQPLPYVAGDSRLTTPTPLLLLPEVSFEPQSP